MNGFIPSLVFLGALAPLATAQNPTNAAFQPNLDALIQEWRADHGSSWRLHRDPAGRASFLFGGQAAPTFAPIGENQWIEVARDFARETQPMHGVPSGQLRTESVELLPLGLAGGTDKMSVKFEQEHGGVPVRGAHFNVLLDMQGRLLAIQNTTLPGLEGLVTQPGLSAASAADRAVRAFDASHGGSTFVGEAELAIVRTELGEEVVGRLAWLVEVALDGQADTPIGERLVIDAQTGQVLDRESTVHNFDVSGTVVSMATPGTHPDTAANPETQHAMPFIRVTSSAGTVFADVNGNFNFPGVNSPLSVTVDYFGTYNNVNNQNGADYSLTQTIQPNTPTTVVMNPSSAAQVTSQANAYLHINTVGEFIRANAPGDTTADFLAVSNPNLSSTCNAFYNGVSTNYYLEGGGCVNTAYSTVVAHEFGHWLNDLYGTGNGSDGMGEGNADVFAMYSFDAPIVGFDFCGSGCHVRNGNNTRQYCGDGNGGCYGQVHADGEVWMGAAWKVRRNLKTTLGNGPGGAAANALFLGWMNGFNQSQIDSVIELQWLTLDDNDGNIDNGTPNYLDIDGAFLEQGFPGFVLPAVIFNNVTQLPDTTGTGPFTVDATVTANLAPAISGVELFWRTEGGSFSSVAMTSLGSDLYRAQIPQQSSPELVEYYLEGTDTLSNTNSFPSNAPAEVVRFGIGQAVTFLAFDFEAAGDQGWTVGDTGDNATTGIWERGDPRGTAAQPENDVSQPGTNCWFTGQGPIGGGLGDNDVDAGTTTLKSPVFDASGLAGASVNYWRWYSNNQGASPNADIFVVDISNNGGTSWTNVETVGPAGNESNGGWFFHEFVISDFVTPTANMQLRFKASDLGSGSIVEAAIDEVGGVGFESACPAPTNFCVAAANSAGSGCQISSSGSASVAANDLTLFAFGGPAGQPALFFYGDGQQQLAFGNGFRCVGGTAHRFPVQNLDLFGSAQRALDLNNLPGGDTISIGETVHFQFWYRDPAGGGAAFNLSDGLTATFCP